MVSFRLRDAVKVLFALGLSLSLSAGALAQTITAVEVIGNKEISSQYIASVFGLSPGDPFDPQKVREGLRAVFDTGFFRLVDADTEPHDGGVKVVVMVVENPKVETFKIEGSTVFKEDDLKAVCMTTPGLIFNSQILRRDLDRIKEKYSERGYPFVNVRDVSFEGGNLVVKLSEVRVGEILVQGNKRTKEHVIRRYITLSPGDVFNSNMVRYTLNKLQALGYFEDVTVGFEPTESPDVVNLVVTVKEGKVGRAGFGVAYGSQSGWSGSVVYENINWRGLGQNVQVGAEFGGRERYWVQLEEPWMDERNFAWKVGVYRRFWEDLERYEGGELRATYDESKQGAFFGFGRKLGGDLSFYLTFDWKEVEVTVKSGDLGDYYRKQELLEGTNFTASLSLTRSRLDQALPYKKGDVETVFFEKALKALGGDWDYSKYGLELRYYAPVANLLSEVFGLPERKDRPAILALRAKAAFSDGEVPWAELYFLGGDSGLRGYRDDYFAGHEMFLGNAELRIPVDDNLSVVVFHDVGNAWNKRAGKSFSFDDLKSATGAGIRVMTPLGYVRLDVANGEEETRTHFSIGELF